MYVCMLVHVHVYYTCPCMQCMHLTDQHEIQYSKADMAMKNCDYSSRSSPSNGPLT